MNRNAPRTWLIGVIVLGLLAFIPWTWKDRALIGGWFPAFILWGCLVMAAMEVFLYRMSQRAWPEPGD